MVWQYEHGLSPLALGEAWRSIANALQGLRFTMLATDDQLRVSYAVAEVISAASRRPLGSADAGVRFEFESFVWRVACAWAAFLAGDIGAVRTRTEILENVWDAHWYGPTKTVDAHVASLRKKLGGHEWIQAVRGVGFRLEPPE